MKWQKRLLKSKPVQAAASRLLAGFIRLVFFTSRIDRHIDPGAQAYMNGHGNAIFAFWHGRMMLLPAFCPPGHTMRVLISLHRDGRLISDTIGHFGQKTVTGSSSRGGKEAVMEILRSLEAGDNISITPDGPRGPAQVLQKGIVMVARHSGRPVLPVTFSSTRHKHFKSWDRFMLALPFGRIAFCVGAPIFVKDDTDEAAEEKARVTIETAMNALVEKADGLAHA